MVLDSRARLTHIDLLHMQSLETNERDIPYAMLYHLRAETGLSINLLLLDFLLVG